MQILMNKTTFLCHIYNSRLGSMTLANLENCDIGNTFARI